jgi:hypothetical protein
MQYLTNDTIEQCRTQLVVKSARYSKHQRELVTEVHFPVRTANGSVGPLKNSSNFNMERLSLITDEDKSALI